jgi:hypothetical protein
MARKPETDIRVAATSKIWGFATGMLALCIPLSAVTKSGAILPLAVMSGAAVGTVAVWRGSDNQSRNKPLLTNSIKELEQRVANLETICSNQELDLQNKIKQLESKD